MRLYAEKHNSRRGQPAFPGGAAPLVGDPSPLMVLRRRQAGAQARSRERTRHLAGSRSPFTTCLHTGGAGRDDVPGGCLFTAGQGERLLLGGEPPSGTCRVLVRPLPISPVNGGGGGVV